MRAFALMIRMIRGDRITAGAKAVLLLGLTVGAATCSSVAVRTAAAPSADFPAYRTYSWLPNPPGQSGMPGYEAVDRAVRADVDRALAAKGLARIEGPKADLLVSYTAISEQTLIYGAVPGPSLWGADEEIYPSKVGSLTVQLTERRSGTLVWQGTAEDAVDDPRTSQKDIALSVRTLFKGYPSA